MHHFVAGFHLNPLKPDTPTLNLFWHCNFIDTIYHTLFPIAETSLAYNLNVNLKLTQQQMPAVTSNSPKLRSTAKPPRSPRTPRSHNSSRSSSRCSSSNNASSPLFHRALLPLDRAEKPPRRLGRSLSPFPRLQHRLSYSILVIVRVVLQLLVPADLFFYTRLLSLMSISPTPLLLTIPFVSIDPLSRLCHDITL